MERNLLRINGGKSDSKRDSPMVCREVLVEDILLFLDGSICIPFFLLMLSRSVSTADSIIESYFLSLAASSYSLLTIALFASHYYLLRQQCYRQKQPEWWLRERTLMYLIFLPSAIILLMKIYTPLPLPIDWISYGFTITFWLMAGRLYLCGWIEKSQHKSLGCRS